MSHLIPIESIFVAERQRRSIAKPELAKLKDSIERNGLLHAPVVEPTGSNSYSLLAGERRFRAIELMLAEKMQVMYDTEMVSLGFIPVTFRSELDDTQRQEIELEENILRVGLTWQEEAAAIAKLHALRQAQAPGALPQFGGQTFTATAQELSELRPEGSGVSTQKVSRAVLVAQHMSNPKVASAKSLKDAYNVISREFEAGIKADLITALDQSSEHELLNGSCIELLPQMDRDIFDCILTDPPYGMGADSFGEVSQQHHYKDDQDTAFQIAKSIFQEGYRLCRDNAHIYMFCDISMFDLLSGAADSFGWQVFRTPIIWDKGGGMGIDPWPQQGFRRSYECILYAMKGKRPYNLFLRDIVTCPSISDPYHPAAKPPELFKKLLERTCFPGDRVLDPCCGIGTIFDAANALKLRATGIELDPAYAMIASNKRFEGR